MPVTKNLLTALSISGDNDGVTIRIADRLSGIEFFEARIAHEEFSKALGRLAARPMVAEVRRLDRVGLKMVREPRMAKVEGRLYRESGEKWLQENAQEPGWVISTYLGSQKSIHWDFENNVTILHYWATKYVEPTEEDLQKLQKQYEE